MKLRNLLLPFLAVLLLAACNDVKEPEFRRIGNFRVHNLGLQDVTIGFEVTYFNPNNFGVTVKEATADVFMDSVHLGQFTQDSTIAVNRNGEFTIPLSGKISLATALRMDLRNMTQRKVQVKADGSVKVGKAGIFMNRPFKYEGLHALEDLDF